jgi:hypothetical protein
MKCPQAEKLLEDYNDGELDPKEVSGLEDHLASCANCARLLESLHCEAKLYEDYGRNLDSSLEIMPSMWARICNGAEAETHASGSLFPRVFVEFFSKILPNPTMGRQFVMASILVIISICGTLLVVHYHQKSAVTAGIETSRQVIEAPSRSLESALLSIKKAEQQYVEAIGTLSEMVDKKKDFLDPALAAEMANNLKVIDEAIESSRRAYYAHPTNPELARCMLNAYQKKVGLLQNLALGIT